MKHVSAALLCVLLSTGTIGTVVGAPILTRFPSGAVVNWSSGVMTATGAAHADIRAPSPGVARIKAKRQAIERARQKLAEAASKLPGLSREQADDARRAQEWVVVQAVEHTSDGLVVAKLSLALDSVRTSIWGPDSLPTAELAGVIVKVRRKPSIGLVLRAGEQSYRGPVLFVDSVASAEKRFGTGTQVISGRSSKSGVLIEDDKLVGDLRASRGLVIVVKK